MGEGLNWSSEDDVNSSGEETIEITDEIIEVALQIEPLLAIIIEQGPDLDSAHLSNLRAQLQSLLQQLGCTNINDQRLAMIIASVRNPNIVLPTDYPSFEQFEEQYYDVLHEDNEQVHFPKNTTFREVVNHGNTNWNQVQARGAGITTTQYLFELGKVLANKYAYGTIFPASDDIVIDQTGGIQNGRHRVLTGKCLTSRYLDSKGLNNWIPVKVENQESY